MKALREQQRSRLDGRHRYIMGLVAVQVGLSASQVEDYLLDGNQVLKVIMLQGIEVILYFSWTDLMISLLLMACSAFCFITKKQMSQSLVGDH